MQRVCMSCGAQYDDSLEEHIVLERPRAVSCVRVDTKSSEPENKNANT